MDTKIKGAKVSDEKILNNNILELRKNLHESQDKFIYFLLATTIASIGFTVTTTKNLKLKYTQIPLGISVVIWGISFWCGCKNRQYVMESLYINGNLLKAVAKQDSDFQNNSKDIGVALESYEKKSEKANLLFKGQFITFIVGVFFYVAWHVLEMYLRK